MKEPMKVYSKEYPKLYLNVTPGHFASDRFHINYYIDMTSLKMRQINAKEVAKAMSKRYVRKVDISGNNRLIDEMAKQMAAQSASVSPVDTIICMDGCELVGGFMANALSSSAMHSMNSKNDICVITPEFNSNGQIIFRDNIQPMVWEKRVLLLVASATTGKTINRSLECIKYYGGNVVGIAALFSAIREKQGIPVDAIFTQEDIPNYRTYSFEECPDCKEKRRIDAIVNSYGYSKL